LFLFHFFVSDHTQDFKPPLHQQDINLGNIRRSRGYSYEHTLVQRLNDGSWIARRLGGSSTGLPDIVAVNNKEAILLSIEAKSGTGDTLYVGPDQLHRCLLIKDMFGYYRTKHVILAFKFMRKKRVTRKKQVVYEKRRLVEYYKIADKLNKLESVPVVKCTYSGKTYVMYNGKFTMQNLPSYIMPFQVSHVNNNRKSMKIVKFME
jgi:Holliday junction resolvase